VEPGYRFPAEELVVTREEQRKLHGFCAIPEMRYGDWTDPALLARRPIVLNTASMTACHPAYGKVHTVHRIRQFFPVRLGESVTMTGRFDSVTDIPRGWNVRSAWDYRSPDGGLALRVEPEVMMIDPERASTARSPREGPEASTGPRDEGFVRLTHKQCTPESTLGYCEGTQNLIHVDPVYAQGFGFRAPIIAGNQTVNFLLEGLATGGVPASFEVMIRFLRPVFWDDAVDVVGRRVGESDHLTEIRAMNREGRVVADCRVETVRYADGQTV
jgi:acyl dehydratase